MAEKFAKILKKWRGNRLQKEAADALVVSLRTYQGWEQGASEPSEKPSMAEILKRMEDSK